MHTTKIIQTLKSHSFFYVMMVGILHVLLVGFAPKALANSVYAVVNDHIISKYDVEQRTRIIATSSPFSDIEQIKKIAQQELITEAIKISDAKKNKMYVTNEQLNEIVDNIAKKNNVTTKQFIQNLLDNDIDVQALKNKFKAQILWGKHINNKYKDAIALNTEQVIDKIKPDQKHTFTIYKFRQIVFLLTKNSSEEHKRVTHNKAKELAQNPVDCATLDAQIPSESAIRISPTISAKNTELDTKLLTIIQNATPNNLTKPIKTKEGYAMVLLCSKETKKDVPKALLEQYKLSFLNTKLEHLSTRYFQKLRKSAIIEYRDKN